MIVSWNWLKDYVALDMPVADLERRLMLAGLNHESTTEVGGDLAIDLEVTSNRPDCLGHLGIAREAAVVFGKPVNIPPAQARAAGPKVETLTKVTLECPELCPRYTARVVRGIRIGPSPWWMIRRLQTVGLESINNVVDVTNYVMLECGQPLHAFDLAILNERRIVVRRARPDEPFTAINHKTYTLDEEICVIADGRQAVGIGGVMGGAQSEVSESSRDVLLEAAEFSPLSIRRTARKLGLFSDSSYRFERGIDPAGVDWASRRACELIVQLAGGELAQGVVDMGRPPPLRSPVVLRLSQLERILGIAIPPERVRAILAALGNVERSFDGRSVEVIPPSWRGDLTREIDLVEEVGRIYGYDHIPEDVSVPMAVSRRSESDRLASEVRRVMAAAGFDEAYTTSVVEESWGRLWSPWSAAEALKLELPLLRGAEYLRMSLVPSLLTARRINESAGNPIVELFEMARVYLPQPGGLPQEELMLAVTGGGDFFSLKGALEALLDAVNPQIAAEYPGPDPAWSLLDPAQSSRIVIDGEMAGYLGGVSQAGRRHFDLRHPACVAELKVGVLARMARTVRTAAAASPFPAVTRDLNLVVDERIRWSDVCRTVRGVGGETLEQVDYQSTWRSPKELGEGKKSLLFRISLRGKSGTLTTEEADQVQSGIVGRCESLHGARLRQ
jgi:phenylalanyl-tRNA synthetase beta chain